MTSISIYVLTFPAPSRFYAFMSVYHLRMLGRHLTYWSIMFPSFILCASIYPYVSHAIHFMYKYALVYSLILQCRTTLSTQPDYPLAYLPISHFIRDPHIGVLEE